MTGVVKLRQNPANPGQMYWLWDTGRFQRLGGALPIEDGPKWFDWIDGPGRSFWITDWNGPSGYVLDYAGGFHAFGDAPAVGFNGSYIMPGVPYSGVGVHEYVDFSMDPNNSGEGHVLTYYGKILPFGGATGPPRTSALWTQPYAVALEMQYEPIKRSVILDYYGGRNQDFPFLELPRDGYYSTALNFARDMIITDWGDASGPGAKPSGYMLLAEGRTVEWGPKPPQDAFGGPDGSTRLGQVQLGVINPPNPLDLGSGTPANPLELIQVATGGQHAIYIASTPPVVVAGGRDGQPSPAGVTDTTRPLLAFSYSDSQRDRLAEWQMIVWPQSYVDITDMTDPRRLRGNAAFYETGTNSTTRGIVSPVDLANGLWRMYVRAKDTADQWSDWDDWGWPQSVTALIGPSDLTATVDQFHVNLKLTAPVAEVGQYAVIECSDDNGLTWAPVVGAEAVPAETITRTVDRTIPLGQPRTYRGRLFTDLPRKISDPSPEATVTVEQPTFVLTSTVDPSLGGEVFPVGRMGEEREVVAGVHEPMGDELPIIISDSGPKGRRRTLTLDSASRADWDLIAGLVKSGHTLLLREPFGELGYYQVVGRWGRDQIRSLPPPSTATPLAHDHEVQLPLIEVARPLPIPAEDP